MVSRCCLQRYRTQSLVNFVKTLPEIIAMAVSECFAIRATALTVRVLQIAGWAVIAPAAALVAYCCVRASRAAVSVFTKKPTPAASASQAGSDRPPHSAAPSGNRISAQM